MPDQHAVAPDSTAVRVALWRALHVEVDAPPHVLDDRVGLRLVAPDYPWRERPDMDPQRIRLFLASIVARARFIEDLVVEQVGRGVGQYVILGAGLDTFAQRRPEIAAKLTVFEVDQPGTQAWKQQRLIALGFGIPAWLRLVPVDFEAGGSWWERLLAAGFDAGRPAIVASTGVSMYLTKDAIAATLRQVAAISPGSTFVMSFLLPTELADPEVRPGLEAAVKRARQRNAVHQLFHAGGDDGLGARLRLQGRSACISRRARRPIFCGQNRRPSPGKQYRGAAGGGYLVGRIFDAEPATTSAENALARRRSARPQAKSSRHPPRESGASGRRWCRGARSRSTAGRRPRYRRSPAPTDRRAGR